MVKKTDVKIGRGVIINREMPYGVPPGPRTSAIVALGEVMTFLGHPVKEAGVTTVKVRREMTGEEIDVYWSFISCNCCF